MAATAHFVTGIGTDVGKTLAAAVLVKVLNAAYWKPVQCGDLQHTDSMKVKALTECSVHPETYRLQLPMSPHAAAEAENVRIRLSDFRLPQPDSLVVEGAGGILVPLNRKETMLDLMRHLGLPVILVSQHYLGSINHTLMSIEVLKNAGIGITGILFNGEANKSTESIISEQSDVRVLGRIPILDKVIPESITKVANELRRQFHA